MSNVIVWDTETVPDLKGFAAANGHVGKTDDEVRAELGDKFPKHIYHSIICMGALIAHREEGGHWIVDAIGAPHVGERPEKELIASFVEKVAALSPQLVTQRVVLRSAGTAVSSNGSRGCGTGPCRASVFSPVYRGCS
jgi:3'-5' exonuclease